MAKTQSKTEVLAEVEEMFGQVPEWVNSIPESGLPGFWAQFRDFYLGQTSIPNKYKELIGLAVSGATRCHYCSLFHQEAARLFGATDEEIAEASLMGGVTMQASTFINAIRADYDRFAKETSEIVNYLKGQQAKAGKAPTAEQPVVH